MKPRRPGYWPADKRKPGMAVILADGRRAVLVAKGCQLPKPTWLASIEGVGRRIIASAEIKGDAPTG